MSAPDPMSAEGLRAIARRARVAGNASTATADPDGLPALAAAITACEDLTTEDLALLLWEFQRAVQAEVRHSATGAGSLSASEWMASQLNACDAWALERASEITQQTHASGLTVYAIPAALSIRLTCEIAQALQQERARATEEP